MEISNNQIHCKLTFNDQIRRFIFNGNEFSELRNHISTILGIPPETFVLKYLDNEGDRITMTSNEDMALALSLSDKLLRIVVDVPQAVPFQQQQLFTPVSNFPGAPHIQQPFPPQQYSQPYSQQHSQQQSYSGYGHRPHHHGGRGGYFQGGGREIAKARILSKIDMLKQDLAQIHPEEQSNRKQHIQMKIHQLEGKLLRFDTMLERKVMKHQQKTEKKWDNKRLDPQTLNQIQVLKGQVLSLKLSMSQIKEQKKAKKNELQVCLQTAMGDKEAIWKELLTLKESGHEIGKQIAVLKDQIRALRGF